MTDNNSRKQIIKSSSIVGGAQIISIVIGIVRTKVIALLLGPTGIGLVGMLQSTVDLVRSCTGMGINFSGVRDVAEAHATADDTRIACIVTILRRWALWTGVLGMIITVALCIPLSRYSFGNDSYALSIAVLSITLVITSVSAGQVAILQGLRQIGKMAKCTLWGAVVSTVITLPLYWWLGTDGIVPAIIIAALATLLISWLYSRTVKRTPLTVKETFKGGISMAKLGFVVMISSICATAMMYVTRVIIMDNMGIDAVGNFQASWTISTMYINIILSAMLADYFPRLSAVSKDYRATNRLVNEQLELAMLIASILIVTMIGLAPLVIRLLYNNAFSLSSRLLQLQLVAAFFQIVSWPLHAIFLTQKKSIYYLILTIASSILFLALVYLGWERFGFYVLGYALIVSGFFSALFIIISCRLITNFRFTIINIRLMSVVALLTGVTIACSYLFQGLWLYITTAVLIIVASTISIVMLNRIINLRELIRSKLIRGVNIL